MDCGASCNQHREGRLRPASYTSLWLKLFGKLAGLADTCAASIPAALIVLSLSLSPTHYCFLGTSDSSIEVLLMSSYISVVGRRLSFGYRSQSPLLLILG